MPGQAQDFPYFLACLLSSTGTLSQDELVSVMIKAGSIYFYGTLSINPAIYLVNKRNKCDTNHNKDYKFILI